MPLKHIQTIDPNGLLSVWTGTESNYYFASRLKIQDSELSIIDQFTDKRKREWLTSRYLLHIMTGQRSRTTITKDEHGKPILCNSLHHISLSHSGDKTAVIASKCSVGIDIQRIVSKIERISRKFCNETELSQLPISQALLYYHLIWGAKECIYKSYGKRKVDFRDHMTISGISNNLQNGTCDGTLRIPNLKISKAYQIQYQMIDDYMLVYSVEKQNLSEVEKERTN